MCMLRAINARVAVSEPCAMPSYFCAGGAGPFALYWAIRMGYSCSGNTQATALNADRLSASYRVWAREFPFALRIVVRMVNG